MDSTGVQFLSGIAGGVGTGLQQRQEQQRQDKVRQEDVAFRERQLGVQQEQAQAERENRITLQNLQSNLERTLTEMKIGSGEKLTMAELAARQSEGEANRTAEAENIGRRADAEIKVVGAQGKETRQTQAAGSGLDQERIRLQYGLEYENAKDLLQERLDADKDMEMWRTEWETGDRARARNEAALNLKKREATFMANLQARIAKEQAKYGADLDIRKAVVFAAQDMYKAREMQHMDMMSTLFKLAAGTQSQMDPQAFVDLYFDRDPTVDEMKVLADTIFMKGDTDDLVKLAASVSDTRNSGIEGLLTSLRSAAQGILLTDGTPSQNREREFGRRFGMADLPGGTPNPEKAPRTDTPAIPPKVVMDLPPESRREVVKVKKEELFGMSKGIPAATPKMDSLFQTMAQSTDKLLFADSVSQAVVEFPVEQVSSLVMGDKAYTTTFFASRSWPADGSSRQPVEGRNDPELVKLELSRYAKKLMELPASQQTEKIIDHAYRYKKQYDKVVFDEVKEKAALRKRMGESGGLAQVAAWAFAWSSESDGKGGRGRALRRDVTSPTGFETLRGGRMPTQEDVFRGF